MDIHPSERIVLFIDGPNLHSTAKALGFDIDYKRLLALFGGRGRLIRAIYYTTVLEQDEFVSIRPLVDWLEYNGYTLVTKPAKEFVDSLGRRRLKGSMDVELAVDAMRLAPQLDHAIFFTGDGDFRSLVAALQQKGKRVSVISTLQASSMVSDDLRRQADQFVDLADLERLVARSSAPRRAPAPNQFVRDSRETRRDSADESSTRGDDDVDRVVSMEAVREPDDSASPEVENADDPSPVVERTRPRTRRPTTK